VDLSVNLDARFGVSFFFSLGPLFYTIILSCVNVRASEIGFFRVCSALLCQMLERGFGIFIYYEKMVLGKPEGLRPRPDLSPGDGSIYRISTVTRHSQIRLTIRSTAYMLASCILRGTQQDIESGPSTPIRSNKEVRTRAAFGTGSGKSCGNCLNIGSRASAEG
jgi:hypothetical protein